MRVLLGVPRYFPYRGGVETVVRHLAAELIRQGHEVRIVTNKYPRSLPRSEQVEGIEVWRSMFLLPEFLHLKAGRPDLWLAGWLFGPLSTLSLFRMMQRFRPDVVHLHYLGSLSPFFEFLHRLRPVPTIASLHGGDVEAEPFRSRFHMKVFQAVLRQSSAVTTCSENLRQTALKVAPDSAHKLMVVHNAVDLELFSTAAPFPHPRPYIAAVAQLVWHKGFDFLIEVFSGLEAEFPELDLLIAGEGPERGALEKLIARLGLAGRVVLLGSVPESVVAQVMAGARVVAVPSRREPFGIVALEAL